MTYAELLRYFFAHGYRRVERDDRLFDVFPSETRERGVELWELWGPHEISLVKVELPYKKDPIAYTISRPDHEKALLEGEQRDLQMFESTDDFLSPG